ncbi:M55 family metallopeptidase [Candidatus Neomarinimicrobiota bacterium]
MKIYISADIEGVCGSTHWNEADNDKSDYGEFQKQMTAEVTAVCKGAMAAGVKDITVQDAHGTGRNITAKELPDGVKLIRGWSGHPNAMVQELDKSFDALMFVGYHSHAGSSGNPLAHTMRGSHVDYLKINEHYASEFLLHGLLAATLDVPVAFLAGDNELCKHVKNINKNITTVAVKEGIGDSTVSLHPKAAIEKIWQGTESALKGDLTKCRLPIYNEYNIELRFKKHQQAFDASFYPGCKLLESQTITFNTNDYFEVMRMMHFVIK